MNESELLTVVEIFDRVFPSEGKPQPPSRFQRQRFIEDSIALFRPDYNEAMELLDALLCGLRERFNDDLGPDVEGDFQHLRESLNEADAIHLRRTYKPEAYE